MPANGWWCSTAADAAGARPMDRTRPLLALALALALLPGCAGVLRSYDLAPSGLARTEEELRHALRSGLADSSLVHQLVAGERSPDDELLRALQGGITAYYAGRYAESGALLDVAAALAETRVTKSVSRSALALVTNDGALPWEPSRTERLLIPYYGSLAYLRQHDLEGAAVEARRLAALLEEYEGDVARDEPRLHATLRYVAGAIFEAYGDRNDAAVSYRHAAGLAGLDTVLARIPADSGDVVVLLDHGFVAHRVEQSLNVVLVPDELHRLREGDPDLRLAFGNDVAGRVMTHAGSSADRARAPTYVPAPDHLLAALDTRRADRCREPRPRGRATGSGRVVPDSTRDVRPVATRVPAPASCDDGDDDRAPYLLRVAWPAYRWTDPAPAGARVLRGGDDAGTAVSYADVSGAVVHDFERELPLIIARTLVRGAAKAALTRSAEKKLEEKHETLGRLVGILGNVGNALLERADTRSWHLLPGSIGVARLRLPVGEHALSVRLDDGVELPVSPVRVRSGRTVVVNARSW